MILTPSLNSCLLAGGDTPIVIGVQSDVVVGLVTSQDIIQGIVECSDS